MRIKRKSMRFGIRLPCRMREGAYSDSAVSAGKRLFFHGIIIRRNGDIGKEYLGVHDINGRKVKVGGPGCVGTLPEYRDKGIGLTMIKHVTQILKEEGYDYSYIHYTGVAPWYEKLGYQTTFKWTGKGVL